MPPWGLCWCRMRAGREKKGPYSRSLGIPISPNSLRSLSPANEDILVAKAISATFQMESQRKGQSQGKRKELCSPNKGSGGPSVPPLLPAQECELSPQWEDTGPLPTAAKPTRICSPSFCNPNSFPLSGPGFNHIRQVPSFTCFILFIKHLLSTHYRPDICKGNSFHPQNHSYMVGPCFIEKETEEERG